jgi:hypothetical protein
VTTPKSVSTCGRITSLQGLHDLFGADGVVLAQIARDRDQAHAVLPVDGRKALPRGHGHDIGERHVFPAAGPEERAVEEVGRQFALGHLHPDRRGARPVGEGRGLDPAQPVAQDPAQVVDGEAQRLALRGQLEAQLLPVVGHGILEPRHLGVDGQRGRHRLRRRLQRRGSAP